MSMTLQELYNDIELDINNEFPRLMEGGDEERFINESLDSIIPTDNGSLAELLESCNDLANVEDSGTLGENPSVWDIIGRATYYKVREHGIEHFNEKKKEYEELVEESSEGFQTGYESSAKPRKTYLYLDLDDAQKYPDGVALHSGNDKHPALYEGELFIRGGFKNDYEAWTWLEQHSEEINKEIEAWKETQNEG